MGTWYFASGSNVCLDHFKSFLADQGVDPDSVTAPQHAILSDYRLRIYYLFASRGAGACNIEPAEDHRVEGMLMPITSAARDALRLKGSWPLRYCEIIVTVAVPSIAESFRAITYIVAPDRRLPIDVPVSRRYRQLILDGRNTWDSPTSTRST